ncbi:hypothetical protein PC9H_011419 [Pleurotus ostreatus]|uniref:Uncharacterized protein n=1 Tax=Pleurotus ostreatus TaxID=5322 RepID=A0A8H6ZIM6_PLEOS|nr:uncharacterized protein PC9H_011419 [Pleurotus ostreatus]KAF7420901.1 hypothetical protein PC9H_011419 [Pleurotus ostreatus]
MPASAPSFDLYPPFFAAILSERSFGPIASTVLLLHSPYITSADIQTTKCISSLCVCASMSIMEFKPLLGLNSVVAIPRTLMLKLFDSTSP